MAAAGGRGRRGPTAPGAAGCGSHSVPGRSDRRYPKWPDRRVTVKQELTYYRILYMRHKLHGIMQLQIVDCLFQTECTVLERGLPFSTYAILHAIWTHPPPFCM